MNKNHLPEKFLTRLPDIIPEEFLERVIESFSAEKTVCFRINTLKSGSDTALSELSQCGFRIKPVSWYEDAFVLENGAKKLLQETEAYLKGHIYIQGLSSMMVPLILNPSSGEKVLDITAAPGSKTAQLAALMRNRGEITANDAVRKRFFKLKANMDHLGVTNIRLMQKRGEILGNLFPEYFDKVLLDAPCSSEGRFNINDIKTYRYWRPAKSREMMKKQKPLLSAAINALKPSGILVYSTCTFAPLENEIVIDWALKRFGDCIRLENIKLPIRNKMPGLTRWNNKDLHPSLSRTVRILPEAEMDAFFIAKIRKVA